MDQYLRTGGDNLIKNIKLHKKLYRFIDKLIKNNKKVHKIDLKNGEMTWIVGCILFFISVGIEFLNYKIKVFDLNGYTILSRGILMSFLIIGLIEIIKFLLGYIFTELKFIRNIDKKLKRFIKVNNLAEFITTKNGFKKVKYCPTVTYQVLDEKVIVKFKLDGGPKSNSYCKLKDQLQGILGMKCMMVEIAVSWCVYEFRKGNIKALDLVKDIIESEKSAPSKDTIPINKELKWNFRKSPHALISGITGAGKTYFLAYIIRMLLSYNANVSIIDPKRSDLSFLKKYLGANVVYDNSDIVKLMENKVDEMEKRFDEFKKLPEYSFGKDYYDYGYDADVIIIDELMAFMGGSAEPENKKAVMNAMTDIVAKGRQSGFFVILSTQRSDTRFIDGALRDQLGLRTALGKMSEDGYKMVFGTGQKLLLTEKRNGAGFIYIDGTTRFPSEFNAPYLNPDYDFIKDIENLLNKTNSKQKENDNKKLNKIELAKSNDVSFNFSDISK
jgi:hypothetical protein